MQNINEEALIEQKHDEQEAVMYEKFDANIRSLCRYYPGMETYIAFAILCGNARAFAKGQASEIWPGAGTVNMPELVEDVKKLDSFFVYPD